MNKTLDERTIHQAAVLLHEAAPGATIILFGSCARRKQGPESDADFLVVEPEVQSRHEEMVRLRDVLRPLHIPVDVLVTNQDTYDHWSDTPGTVYYEANREGRVLDGFD